MKVKAKINGAEYILLGENPEKYLIYPDVSGMASWTDKHNFYQLEKLPDYWVDDDDLPNQKVVEIYKRKYDIDFHVGPLHWNETLTPHYFRVKRLELALLSIGHEGLLAGNENSFDDNFYFSMLVGKFETINEIIDAQIQDKEEHSRFEWRKYSNASVIEEPLSNAEIEQGIIELCKFVSPKVIKNKYSDFLFTDLYAIWKTFLLGNEFTTFGEIKIAGHFEPKFICTFKKGAMNYHFNYQYLLC